jgi:hypothetical protein
MWQRRFQKQRKQEAGRMRQLPTVLLVTAITTFVAAAPAQEKVRQALDLQSQSLEASADIQRRIDALDDETRSMLDEYRRAMAQVEDLTTYNEQLERLVATQRVELADFERKFQDIEVTKRQILPLIMRMTEVLEDFVAIDIPFLERERSTRIAELNKLMQRPDVPTSEKYRRTSEAYQIELEYGHTIEAYEGEMEVGGESRTVAFLRFGRLGLYYMTLDGQEIGFWDSVADEWVVLGEEFRQPLDRAIRIARKQLPPDLIRLPIPAPGQRS